LIFPDAVDPSGEMILGAERGLEEAVDDLAVGKRFLFRALALRDGGNFGRRKRRPDDGRKRDAGQNDRNNSEMR
jgi:hypothetical protein